MDESVLDFIVNFWEIHKQCVDRGLNNLEITFTENNEATANELDFIAYCLGRLMRSVGRTNKFSFRWTTQEYWTPEYPGFTRPADIQVRDRNVRQLIRAEWEKWNNTTTIKD